MGKHDSHPDIVKRLKRASGHLNKVIAMIEAERPCPVVAQQLHAVAKAITNAKTIYVQDHIEHCIDGGIDQADDGDVRALIDELKDVAKYL
ncbi:MAG: metal-sensing transcriptional repressor [Rhodospirillales bacterium]|nr:metal-sensing transcriptional repressor [Rhodospirillales bacterium]